MCPNLLDHYIEQQMDHLKQGIGTIQINPRFISNQPKLSPKKTQPEVNGESSIKRKETRAKVLSLFRKQQAEFLSSQELKANSNTLN